MNWFFWATCLSSFYLILFSFKDANVVLKDNSLCACPSKLMMRLMMPVAVVRTMAVMSIVVVMVTVIMIAQAVVVGTMRWW